MLHASDTVLIRHIYFLAFHVYVRAWLLYSFCIQENDFKDS